MMHRPALAALVAFALLAAAAYAASATYSPSSCSGQWENCSRAFADDSSRSAKTATNTANRTSTWQSYGISLPSNATITNVSVRADFFASNSRGYFAVRVSGNGGSSFGPAHTAGGNTAERTYTFDVTNDLSWTPAKLNDTNLRVNVTCFKSGSGSNPS